MRLPMPPILAALAMLCTWAARGWLPGLPAPWGLAAGGLVALAGLGLIGAAAARFAAAATTVNPARPDRSAALVTTGPNARSRNPMYLGEVAVVLGFALAVAPLPGALAAAAFWLYLDRVQIPAEERALAARFGADFAAYTARVPRWL